MSTTCSETAAESADRGSAPRTLKPEKCLRIVSLLLCCILMVTFGCVQGHNLGAAFSNDYDEGVYLCSARALNHGSPLFSSIFSSQPPVFIESLAFCFRVFGESVETGRGMILFFALLGLLAIAWITWQLISPLSAPVAMLCLVLPTSFFHTARTCAAEMPSLSLGLLAIGCALSSRGRWQLAWLAGAGICFAIGALFKLLVVPLALPLVLIACFPTGWLEAGGWRLCPLRSCLIPRLLAFVVPGLLAAAAIIARYDLRSVFDQTVRFHEASKAAYPVHLLSNCDTLLRAASGSCGIAVLSIIGLVLLWRTHSATCLWLCAWALAVTSFLATHSPLFDRHLILLLPPFAVAASACFAALSGRTWQSWLLTAYFLALPLIGFEPNSVQVRFSPLNCWQSLSTSFPADEREVMQLIQARAAPADYIVSDQQMQAFRAGRLVPPGLCDTSYNRIASGYLSASEAIKASRGARLVIFWTGRLERLSEYHQWICSNYKLVTKHDDKEIYSKGDLVK